MLKPIGDVAPAVADPQQLVLDEDGIRHVFKVLHGFYGQLFLSKFATGRAVDEGPYAGEDEGIVNARRIWAFSLREHAIENIKLALRRCQAAHVEYPPSLPQFLALCDAIAPRRAPKREVPATPAIDLDLEVRARLREENRRRATEAAHRPVQREPQGLDLLKQAIGDATRVAGGDEGAVLLRLDRELAPRETA